MIEHHRRVYTSILPRYQESTQPVRIDPGASYCVRFSDRQRRTPAKGNPDTTQAIDADPRQLASDHSLSPGDNYLDTHRSGVPLPKFAAYVGPSLAPASLRLLPVLFH